MSDQETRRKKKHSDLNDQSSGDGRRIVESERDSRSLLEETYYDDEEDTKNNT